MAKERPATVTLSNPFIVGTHRLCTIAPTSIPQGANVLVQDLEMKGTARPGNEGPRLQKSMAQVLDTKGPGSYAPPPDTKIDMAISIIHMCWPAR